MNYNKNQGGDWNADEENYTEQDIDMAEGKKGGRARKKQDDTSEAMEDDGMESNEGDFNS